MGAGADVDVWVVAGEGLVWGGMAWIRGRTLRLLVRMGSEVVVKCSQILLSLCHVSKRRTSSLRILPGCEVRVRRALAASDRDYGNM